MSLYKAEIEIKKIMMECEQNGTSFNEMFNKLRAVECYGIMFPMMMLMNIADEFIKSYKDRKEKPDVGDLQEKWDVTETSWNCKND
tara:strand:- start:296 stop:553 length:258 start_codon:yes stop_codon:yes gene_type:complete